MDFKQGVAVFLEKIERQFNFGSLNKEAVQNMDKTHFFVNMHNGHIRFPRNDKGSMNTTQT